MRNNTKLRLRWGDFLIFLAIIAAACGIWIHLAMLQTDQTYGEIWPGIATIMIRHDAFIAPVMIRQKTDTIYEIVYKAYTYGHGVDKNLVLNYKPSSFVKNLIDEADDIVYYAYPHPDKNVMENNRMLGRVFGQKIIPILKEKEYIKEVTNFDTILPFVNSYLHNMKKALKEAQIKSIS